MAKSGMDPLGQFTLVPGFGPVGHAIGFSNSNEMMLLAAAIIIVAFAAAVGAARVVPGRLQGLVEVMYEFVHNMVTETMGHEGLRFFPLVFTIFSFVLVGNVLGLFPYFFPFTSHIAVTFSLALFIFLFATLAGFWFQGLGFLKLFAPAGVPVWLYPLLTPIEIVSYLSRPISLSVRLFANMLAGHIAMKVFAGFIVALVGAGAFAVLAPLPFLIIVALTALEFLVAGLQAYVFTILTCIYLNDALHPGH